MKELNEAFKWYRFALKENKELVINDAGNWLASIIGKKTFFNIRELLKIEKIKRIIQKAREL